MKLERGRADEILKQIQNRKVAVLGDLMLDEYLFGEVSRISPEAPVPIVRITRERSVLGGAANVSANLKAIGATPALVGVLGKDRAGHCLLETLEKEGIDGAGIVMEPGRPTTLKTRVIGQQQQMLRIDREERNDLADSTLDCVLSGLEKAMEGACALIVSDYAKGMIVAPLMERVKQLCSAKNIPWIVDPKPSHRALYQGATLMTPNTRELAELAHSELHQDNHMAEAGRRLTEDLSLQGLLVTRSEKGMALLMQERSPKQECRTGQTQAMWSIPTESREVYDVSGAGDTVVAVFSAAVGSGAHWVDAAMLANAAAGVVVGKMGTATVTPQELLQRYQEQVAFYQQQAPN